MSYCLNIPCATCKKEYTCIDGPVLRNAVSTIHDIGFASDSEAPTFKAHRGCGSITLDCQNKAEKETPAT